MQTPLVGGPGEPRTSHTRPEYAATPQQRGTVATESRMTSSRRIQPSRASARRELPASDEPLKEIDVLMIVPEVARLLRTTPKAIYTMVERGQLPVIRINRRVLVGRQDLVDWLRQKSTPSPKE